MARPSTISTKAILDVARELFTKRGPDVPTAEIAREAGVSEGSIFRRFPTKQALFLAALGVDGEPSWVADLRELPGEQEPRVELVTLLMRILEFHREMVPRMMLLWSANPSLLRRVHAGGQSPIRPGVAAVVDYFDRLMCAGRVRPGHPEIVARALLGAVHNYCFMEAMGIEIRGPLDAETFVRSLVDTLWQGIAPPAETETR